MFYSYKMKKCLVLSFINNCNQYGALVAWSNVSSLCSPHMLYQWTCSINHMMSLPLAPYWWCGDKDVNEATGVWQWGRCVTWPLVTSPIVCPLSHGVTPDLCHPQYATVRGDLNWTLAGTCFCTLSCLCNLMTVKTKHMSYVCNESQDTRIFTNIFVHIFDCVNPTALTIELTFWCHFTPKMPNLVDFPSYCIN